MVGGDADVLPVEATIWAGPAEQPRTKNDEGPAMGVENSAEFTSSEDFIAPPHDFDQASVEDWLRSISRARSLRPVRSENALVESIAGPSPTANEQIEYEPANTGTWETIPDTVFTSNLDAPLFGEPVGESAFELPELFDDVTDPLPGADVDLGVPDLDSFGSAPLATPTLTDAQRSDLRFGPTAESAGPVQASVFMEPVTDSDSLFSLEPLEPIEPLAFGDPAPLNIADVASLQVLAAPPGADVLFGEVAPTVTSVFRQHLNDAAKAANPGLAAPPSAIAVPTPESLVYVPSSPAGSPQEIAVPTLPPLPAAAPKSQPFEPPSNSTSDRSANGFEISSTVKKLPGTGSSVIAARRLTKIRTIGGKPVEILSDVTLDLRAGHFIVITGASGSGKTTLLSCLAGIDTFDRGELLFEGHALTDLTESDRARHRAAAMGFVFQSFHLVSVLTAVENVELPLLVAGWSADEARDEAIAALSLVGLTGRRDQLPDQLSGGEQQRVAIARALVGEPRIVFADEPTGNLDDASARKIAHLFHELHADGLTVVVASHDERLMALATTIIDVDKGRVIERPGPRTIV